MEPGITPVSAGREIADALADGVLRELAVVFDAPQGDDL
jgi:hypothetical protein